MSEITVNNPQIKKIRKLNRLTFWSALQYSILAIMLILAYIPMIMGIQMSLKRTAQIHSDFFALPNPVMWSNYSTAILELLGPLGNTM